MKIVNLKCITLSALAVSLFASTAKADLVLGWDDWGAGHTVAADDNNGPQGASPALTQASGDYSVVGGATITPTGGSSDQTHGSGFNAAPPVGLGPLAAGPVGGNNGFVTVFNLVSKLVFSITNTGETYLRFLSSRYDAKAQAGYTGDPSTAVLVLDYSIPAQGKAGRVGTQANGVDDTQFQDLFSNGNLAQGAPIFVYPGQTVNFTFSTTGQDFALDNVAFSFAAVAVPEPASMIGVGGLIGAALTLRNRRRKA